MWAPSFQGRLASWVQLRNTNVGRDLESALSSINSWWMETPWKPYYLHWDDCDRWPNPWQLLETNVFCDLARALGMCYTIEMMQHADIQDYRLIETENSNLVLVNQGKYILNYDTKVQVNTTPEYTPYRRSITQDRIQNRC
jgi:hypothetical protein